MNQTSASFLPFLIELRKRLLSSLLIFLIVFAILFFFANDLYAYLALPLLKQLPAGHNLIATQVTAPFLVPLQLTLLVAFFLTIPVFLYQLWAFVAPALYRHERKQVWILLAASTVLFYAGVAFAYFAVFPLVFKFLTHTVPPGVSVSPDISQYLDFTLQLFLIFGVIFEIPVATILLIKSGVTSRERLITWRPYVIVLAFVLGMLLSPPDVLSQVLLAVPMWLLFEIGIFLAPLFSVKDAQHDSSG